MQRQLTLTMTPHLSAHSPVVSHYIRHRSEAEFYGAMNVYSRDTHAVYNLIHTSVFLIDCPTQILMAAKCREEIVFLVLSGQLIRFSLHTDVVKHRAQV